MAKVAALFSDDAAVSAAISGLVEGGFDEVETQVINEIDLNPDDPSAGAIPSLPPFTTGQQAIGGLDPGTGQHMDDFDEELVTDFFREGVQHGGVLLIAEVDEEQEEALVRYLKEAGGRTARGD